MNNKIYMIGSMGSGKSSIGRLLAKKLHLPHYDLDKTIEHNEGMSVTVSYTHLTLPTKA